MRASVLRDGRMVLRMMGSTPVDIPVSRTSAPHLMEQLGLGDSMALPTRP